MLLPPCVGMSRRLAPLSPAAVCHGPCGLVTAQGPDGASILKGKQVAGFSNAEEAAVGKDKVRASGAASRRGLA